MRVTGTNIMSGRTGIATSTVVPTGGTRYRRNIAGTSIVRSRTASNDGIHSSGKGNGKRRTDNRYASGIVKRLTARRAGNASATPAKDTGVGAMTDRLLLGKACARARATPGAR